jgi:hypothetical protein
VIGLARLLAGLAMLVSTTVGALVLTAGPAAACSCVQPSIDFLDTHDVAFSGVVTSRREAGDDVILTLRADRVFKGEVTKRVDVVGGEEGDTCSVEAQDGDRLLVFGSMVDAEVTSSLCSSVTAPGRAYREILAELGEGTAPTAGYMKAERRTLGLTYEQFAAGRAILGALGLALLGYFVFRAWRAWRRTTS